MRGTGFPLDSNINYFLLAEFGNNGVTKPAGAFAKLTDASVTFNHVKGARVRAGLFKYPGSEEGLQAIHVFDYINFSEVANGLLLEELGDIPSGKASIRIGPHIMTVLEQCDFDKQRAAQLLGIGLSSLYRKIDQLQLSPALAKGS